MPDFLSADLILDTDILDAILSEAKRAPDAMHKGVNKSLLPTIRRAALEELRRPVGPVKYPIEWASERQRRAYFASNGFGKGIPYRRTGQLQAAWEVRTTPYQNGLAITLENKTTYAQYVIGDRQQPFHRNTGWPKYLDNVVKLSEYANDALIDLWYSVTVLGATR